MYTHTHTHIYISVYIYRESGLPFFPLSSTFFFFNKTEWEHFMTYHSSLALLYKELFTVTKCVAFPECLPRQGSNWQSSGKSFIHCNSWPFLFFDVYNSLISRITGFRTPVVSSSNVTNSHLKISFKLYYF